MVLGAATVRAGARDLDLTVTARDGEPVVASGVETLAVLPTTGYASPVQTAVARGGGVFRVAGLPLMTAGHWQILVTPPGETARLVLPLTVTS